VGANPCCPAPRHQVLRVRKSCGSVRTRSGRISQVATPFLSRLNSRFVNCILGGPTNTVGMNKYGAVMLGLEAISHPARAGCRDWHILRQACVSRK
jgi:hypothetical protein